MGKLMHMPPRGRYYAHEVGQLAGVSGSKVGQWANYGYIRASQSASGEYPRVYSFQDVAEAIIVHELVEQEVPLPTIRPVVEELRERYGDWPLQHAQLETVSPDAGSIQIAALLVREGEQHLELGKHGWQLVEAATVNLQRVRADLNHGGWAARRLQDLQHIEVDPDLLGGQPAIRGRRVAVSVVAELAGTIDGEEILREDYDLNGDQIYDAQRWWAATRAYETVAA